MNFFFVVKSCEIIKLYLNQVYFLLLMAIDEMCEFHYSVGIDGVAMSPLASRMGNSEPKRTCCMTGYFASTSALYIFTRPLFTFDQVGTPLMFHS
jgi:hypothetical protein